MRFQVSTAVRMVMKFFWVLAPCKLAGRCQRFGEHIVSIFRAEDGDVMFLQNVGIYRRVYTAPKPRISSSK
jgi:hypothetical protein